MDEIPCGPAIAKRADFHLRNASGVLDASAGGARSPADLSRDCAEAGRLRATNEVHPCRATADHGTSVLRVVGLSDDRVFCADGALWHTAGFHVSRGLSPPARNRRNSRLGAVALSFRCARV